MSILQKTHTSTGNRKVFTWACWFKESEIPGGNRYLFSLSDDNGANYDESRLFIDAGGRLNYVASDLGVQVEGELAIRDPGSWMHIMVVVDTTLTTSFDRVKLYLNGRRIEEMSISTMPARDANVAHNVGGNILVIGSYGNSNTSFRIDGYMSDVYNVDGLALTPDVFGFYKDGNGYISAGTTQTTDFRPGQWVPKKPSVIKNTINNNGGLGVNGFYLPMNDSSNFGADFHCDPNSIITLQEDLPQPKVSIASTTNAAGLAYTDVLRADPYANNLVLAVPGVGTIRDYSPFINPTLSGVGMTATIDNGDGNIDVGLGTVSVYYGDAIYKEDRGGSTIDYTPRTSTTAYGTQWTIEFWCNIQLPDSTYPAVYHHADTGSWNNGIVLSKHNTNDEWTIYANSVPNCTGGRYSSVYDSWQHIAAVRDGSKLSLFQNGVCVGINTNYSGTDTTSAGRPIGILGEPGTNNFGSRGYIQDLRVYIGAAKYDGGFDVPKPYTPVGIATWRAVPDCTANNFATLNPLANAVAATLTNGNLQAQPTGANDKHVFSTFGFTSGKWYVEVRDVDQQARGNILVSDANHNATTTGTNNVSVQMWDGTVATSGTDNGNLSAFSTGDILAIAYDADIGSVWLAKNGAVDTSGTAIATGISTNPERDYRFSYRETGGTQTTVNWNFGQNPTFSGQVSAGAAERNADSNGKGEFRYQPPTGFLALCEDNLPTPAIADPGDYFKTVLYTGTGSSRAVTGVGFKPDLVWVKSRTNTEGPIIFDSVRGPEKRLLTFGSQTEATSAGGVMSFDDDGYSTAQYAGTNQSGQNYVAWCWKVGAGTTSVNTDGTINSVVSVNQDAGVSIVTYTSTGSNTATETVGHGLNKTPNMIILKNRSASVNWRVYHSSINDAGKNSVTLNSSEAAYVFWPSVGSDTFGLANSTTTGQAAGTGNQDIVAYCWAEVEGYSKFGSYVGNASADGTFVYCGFKPAFVITKRTDGTSNWLIHDSSRDPVNPVMGALYANISNAEGSAVRVDFVSNGFKHRNADGGTANNNANNYIFIAFAESPFKTANAK